MNELSCIVRYSWSILLTVKSSTINRGYENSVEKRAFGQTSLECLTEKQEKSTTRRRGLERVNFPWKKNGDDDGLVAVRIYKVLLNMILEYSVSRVNRWCFSWADKEFAGDNEGCLIARWLSLSWQYVDLGHGHEMFPGMVD